jgi:hypothetical protein
MADQMKKEDLIAVRNCQPDFLFICPKNWETLNPTEQDGVRFCGVCNEQVFLCETDEEMIAHAKAGHCVAKFLPTDRTPEFHVVGRPKEPMIIDGIYAREMAKSLSLRWIKFSIGDCPNCGFPMTEGLYGQIACHVCSDIPGVIEMAD